VERAPAALKPLIERADAPTEREDLLPREDERRLSHHTSPVILAARLDMALGVLAEFIGGLLRLR
jgi:hypothetical protein